ncbi:MAG: serine/threonine-protein kinase [Blastocatellia bacterium]
MSDYTNGADKIADKIMARSSSAPARTDRPAADRVAYVLSYKFDILETLLADQDCEYYLAREVVGGGLTGLKALTPRAAHDIQKRELFYLEAYAAARLSHFNIVACGRPEQIEGVHFSLFEYKREALTLRQLLDRGGWLDLRGGVEASDQIASALDYAHAAGVLHLDLRPENVLIEPDGWVCVMGFGLEAGGRAGRAYQERSRMAAAPYMSPEQAAGMAVDHRSDLYSLGAILYEMLTDRVPFDSDDADYVRRRQLTDAPAPPHMISANVPEEVSAVVMRLLEKNPDNRFNSAAAFQAALDGALNPDLRRSLRLND